MNKRIQFVLIVLTIACSMRCDLVPELVPTGTPTNLFNKVGYVNWCGCNYLAAGAFDSINNVGKIAVYQFDQTTNTLSLIETPTTFGVNTIPVVAWCPTCDYLVAGGVNNSGNGIIQVYHFFPDHGLELAGSQTILGAGEGIVTSIDWCGPSCTVFAAGGAASFGGIIQVYGFDGSGTFTIGAAQSAGLDVIFSLKWCGDCRYLAAVDLSGNLYVYAFDGSSLTQVDVKSLFRGTYRAIDWCDTCSYVAAGGQDFTSGLGIVNIYEFNGSALSFVTSASIPSPVNDSQVTSLAWCQGCANLAVTGFTRDVDSNEIDVVKLYHFNELTRTLSLVQTYTFTLDFSVNIAPSSLVDWCGSNCCYLAVGGKDFTNGIIQLFRGNTCLIPPTPPSSPTNLTAQKLFHRFPTQIDIINTICWDAVTSAVSYNVYADINLTILLATITTEPLCFSQHQICKGKSSTYYVTAVDANGAQSESAVVTI